MFDLAGMVLVYTVALMAALLLFVGAVFWFGTTQAFAVMLGSGIWWFALVLTLFLTGLMFWSIFTPTYSFPVRMVLMVGCLATIGAMIALGIEFRPFDPENIRLGAIFGAGSGLEHINFSDLPPARSEVSYAPYVPPTANQGNCNGCWAVAAAGVLSARLNIAAKRTRSNASGATNCVGQKYDMWPVSAQTLLEADAVVGGVGKCSTAPYADGFVAALHQGSLSTECVPYFAGSASNCQKWCGSPQIGNQCLASTVNPYVWRSCTRAGVSNARRRLRQAYLIKGEETMKREISLNGPIMCTVNFYVKRSGNRAIWTLSGKSSGIYVSPGFVAKPSMDGGEYTKSFDGGGHTMIVFGYGVAGDGTPYWDVQNSWGGNWGVGGQLKIQRGVDAWNIEGYCAAGLY